MGLFDKRECSGFLEGTRDQEARVGIKGIPRKPPEGASRRFWPFFVTGERQERILVNRRAPGRMRKPPEIFCFTLSMRRSRSARLFKGHTEVNHEGEEALPVGFQSGEKFWALVFPGRPPALRAGFGNRFSSLPQAISSS